MGCQLVGPQNEDSFLRFIFYFSSTLGELHRTQSAGFLSGIASTTAEADPGMGAHNAGHSGARGGECFVQKKTPFENAREIKNKERKK